MNAREVRNTFLEFFRDRDHLVLPSSSVIPHGDRTLLFTNAGMNQFKDIFTGREKPKHPRATTVQKCMRAGGKHNDLDNVGYTSRHLTFFEMLGNFSFGDYFKREAIEFAWELITEKLQISPDRLWATVYHEDDEARELWRSVSGLPEDRIVGLGEKDNYWSMGEVGPCGPCSEILLDRGEAFGAADIENGERFFEIWNLVFMQFDQKADGSKQPLPRPSIDTGMGLERLIMVLQDAPSVFDTDLLRSLIGGVEEITGVRYDPGPEGVPHRVIADHIRSLVFSFADGAEPSNEGRGYVLRRILRRAARYGRKIYDGGPLLHALVDRVVLEMGEAFPEIAEHQEFITTLIRREEERFGETLDNGLQLFEDRVAELRQQKQAKISGDDAFTLWDTFGFPFDLVEQMAKEIDFEVDEARFQVLMDEQRERSRKASAFAVHASGDDIDLARFPETRFVGYDATTATAEVQAAVATAASVEDGDSAAFYRVVLSETPFYAESGGQIGDAGKLTGDGFELSVLDTQKEQGRFVHSCRLRDGSPEAVAAGASVRADVDARRRQAIERNHTATHLLHAALRQVLGTHVRQRGSLVDSARLRFDVTHFQGVSAEELQQVEEIVREQALANTPVETFETDYDDAVRRGAMALFGEKYGDVVRVVRIGDFSMELCGGTHVSHTGAVGPFLVATEASVSAGVRRLEALSGAVAAQRFAEQGALLEELASLLKTQPEGLRGRLEKLLKENRELKAKAKAAPAGAPAGDTRRETIADIAFVSCVVEGADGRGVRDVYDGLKKEAKELVAAVVARSGDKLQMLVGVTPSLVKAHGLDARELFKAGAEPLHGRGGGRPEMAQGGGAGGADAVDAGIEAIIRLLKERLA